MTLKNGLKKVLKSLFGFKSEKTPDQAIKITSMFSIIEPYKMDFYSIYLIDLTSFLF